MCDVLLPPGVNPTAVKYIYRNYQHVLKVFTGRFYAYYCLGRAGKVYVILNWSAKVFYSFDQSLNWTTELLPGLAIWLRGRASSEFRLCVFRRVKIVRDILCNCVILPLCSYV
jgi:hypothetical protein